MTQTISPALDRRGRPTGIDEALDRVSDQLQRLNQAIKVAVEAGATIELSRRSRYHCGSGHWGDQMSPVVSLPPRAGR